MKQVLLVIGILVLAAILYVGGMLLFGIATKFKPEAIEDVAVTNAKGGKVADVVSDSTISFMIWNVGYGGLGKEVDFFYDNGKMVTSPEEHVKKNNAGIEKFLASVKDVDFIMLQEVDRDSKRSWKI